MIKTNSFSYWDVSSSICLCQLITPERHRYFLHTILSVEIVNQDFQPLTCQVHGSHRIIRVLDADAYLLDRIRNTGRIIRIDL